MAFVCSGMGCMHAVVHGCTYVHTFIRVFPCIDTKSEKIPVCCVDFLTIYLGYN